MRAHLSCLALLLSVNSPFMAHGAEGAQSLSGPIKFADLPRLIRDKNNNVQAAQLTLRAERSRTGFLTRSLLPRLTAAIGSEEFRAGSDIAYRREFWKLEASLNLYRGGRDRLENSLRETNVTIAESGATLEFQQELRQARQIFWRIVATTEWISELKEALKKTDSNIALAKKRAGAGVATTADAVQFELHKTLLNQELKRQQLELDLQKNRLGTSLALERHQDLQIAGDFSHPEDDVKVAKFDPQSSPDLEILRSRLSASSFRRDQVSKWWHPKVDLYSSYGLPALSDSFAIGSSGAHEWTAGVRIGLDWGEGAEMRREVEARSIEIEALQRRIQHKTLDTAAADHEFRHDLKLLHELIHDAGQDAEKAESFLQLTEAEYRRGVKNGPDLLAAFQQVYEFKKRRIDLLRDYHETHAALTALIAQRDGN